MTVVLDTNVLVSGIINPFGPPGRIVDLVREGQLILAVDDRILSEYRDVLRRPSLGKYLNLRDIDYMLDYVSMDSVYVIATVNIHDFPDANDAMFLEVALTANVPIITGNSRHFPPELCQGCKILTPSNFFASFTQEDLPRPE